MISATVSYACTVESTLPCAPFNKSTVDRTVSAGFRGVVVGVLGTTACVGNPESMEEKESSTDSSAATTRVEESERTVAANEGVGIAPSIAVESVRIKASVANSRTGLYRLYPLSLSCLHKRGKRICFVPYSLAGPLQSFQREIRDRKETRLASIGNWHACIRMHSLLSRITRALGTDAPLAPSSAASVALLIPRYQCPLLSCFLSVPAS